MGKMMIALVALGAAVIGLGVASRWSQLGLLNSIDTLMSFSSPTQQVARDVAYGPLPRQKLDIWAPTAKATKPRDVVIFFYGGSWNSGERALYAFAGRALAERGYVVVIPDYRLVPDVRFPGFVEDGAAAVAWVHAHAAQFGGNPARIHLTGHSAGAHIAALLSLDPEWLAKAGAPKDSIKSFAGLAGPYDFVPFTSDASKAAFGHLPDPTPTQPISYVRADAPPMLLATGTIDETVKPRNSRVLAEALRKKGAKAATLLYPKLGHSGIIMAFARPFRGLAPVIDDLSTFFDGVR
ncbi:MAG: alpha/beta hydrolase [Chakrabartia sp.]